MTFPVSFEPGILVYTKSSHTTYKVPPRSGPSVIPAQVCMIVATQEINLDTWVLIMCSAGLRWMWCGWLHDL